MAIDRTAVIAAPHFTSSPKMAFNPSPAPAMLPILKASPPIAINIEMKVPKPPTTSLAISWPRLPVTTRIRHMFTCAAMSISMDSKMAKAKLAAN